MTTEQKLMRGTHLIQEFVDFEKDSFNCSIKDVECLRIWIISRLRFLGIDLKNNPAIIATVTMALETSYKMGEMK